ncbi:MAG: DNA alkylation repair protein [Deltaproteobacteria bacterium]|jgi:3-methyladenine DNA glycosylase AlkD|nr:DNA alkylation repair protein [Deltaproteobacteria bacterium]
MDRPTELTELFLKAANPEKAQHLLRFFKTGAGQYGHGDQFLGLPVPLTRSLAKPFTGKLTLPECGGLLDSPWHEIRLAALLIMADSAKRMLKLRDLPGLTELAALYDQRLERANNWDLVDASAYNIMGAYWRCADTKADERRRFLKKWADSGNLWRERAAMVSTLALIRRGSLEDTFRLAEYFINHPHDLMHKASGWMLREAGKKNLDALRGFLEIFHGRLPRTALRYAIERMEPAERKKWMGKTAGAYEPNT